MCEPGLNSQGKKVENNMKGILNKLEKIGYKLCITLMFKGSTDTLFVKEIFLSLGKTVPKYLSMRYPDDYVSFEYSVLTPSLGRDTSLERPTVQRHCPFWTYTDSSGMLRTYTDHPGLMDCFQED